MVRLLVRALREEGRAADGLEGLLPGALVKIYDASGHTERPFGHSDSSSMPRPAFPQAHRTSGLCGVPQRPATAPAAEPLMLLHGGGWPPLTRAAVPVTLPSRVMVSSASGWPSTYRSKKASVTRAVRRSTGLVSWYGIRWLAPNRSR